MMRRVCRPMRAGMVVLLFAVAIGLPVLYFRWWRGFYLVGDLAAPPEDGEGSVALTAEGSGGRVHVPAEGNRGKAVVPARARGGDVGAPSEGSRGTVTVPAQGRVDRGAVPPEGGEGSAEIDALLHEDPRSFYTVYYDTEAITLQRKGASVRLDNARKEYLNRLVEASALDADNQVSNVAFIKTRDTGSTTLGTLPSSSVRQKTQPPGIEVAHFPGYGLTVPIAEAAKKTRESRKRLDIMHYRIDINTTSQPERWSQAKGRYGDVMRDPNNLNCITLFREPRDLLLRFYSSFVEIETKVPIEGFFRQSNPDPKTAEQLRSLGCKDFGIETEADLDKFILTEIPQFEPILLAERFDEGLMALRNLMGWHLVDMTYIPDDRTGGGEGPTGVVRKDSPPFDEVPKDVREAPRCLFHWLSSKVLFARMCCCDSGCCCVHVCSADFLSVRLPHGGQNVSTNIFYLAPNNIVSPQR
ncbi:unnamed protein product [Ectocarpus sp. 8 AP-2014]